MVNRSLNVKSDSFRPYEDNEDFLGREFVRLTKTWLSSEINIYI